MGGDVRRASVPAAAIAPLLALLGNTGRTTRGTERPDVVGYEIHDVHARRASLPPS